VWPDPAGAEVRAEQVLVVAVPVYLVVVPFLTVYVYFRQASDNNRFVVQIDYI
jgi:hypothetical protein